jgi:polysaccharide pyruvyl transferase WcaK-like protein
MNPPTLCSLPAAGPRVLILGAGFGTENRGVAALACGTLAAVFHSFPQASVAFLDYAKHPVASDLRRGANTRHIPTVALRFSKNIFQRNHVVRLMVEAVLLRLAPGPVRKRLVARNEWLRAIAGADLIGAISGGDSFSDLYGARRLLYVCLPQFLVLAMGRPLILLPQSYGPFASRTARAVARPLLTHALRVYSRDAAGVETVRRLAPDARGQVAFAYDMGFALEPSPMPERIALAISRLRGRTPVVGFNLSGLLCAAPAGTRRSIRLREDYAATMREAVTHLVVEQGCTVVLIPHVYGRNGESDATASAHFCRQLPRAVAHHVLIFTESLDQHEVKDLIGRCDLFVGARMHACIAALSQCVPTVALAYSDKFAGVLASIGAAGSVVDLRTATAERIRQAIGAAFAGRVLLRARLQARMPAVRQSVLELFRGQIPSASLRS